MGSILVARELPSKGGDTLFSNVYRAFETLSEGEKSNARGNLFAGLAGTEYLDDFGSGDFLIKNILGADPDSGAVVIGADQVADLDGQPIGKPGTHARAVAQLQAMRGRQVVFHTAVAVVRPDTGFAQGLLAEVAVRFRALTDAEIERYLRLEEPYDCAGSAKCETLGIALLDAIDSDDPTALVGLPLIRTSRLLREAGLDPLAVLR